MRGAAVYRRGLAAGKSLGLQQKQGLGLAELDLQRVVINGDQFVRARIQIVQALRGVRELRCHNVVPPPQDIGGRIRLTVGPPDAFAQEKGQGCGIIRELPSLRKVRHEFTAIGKQPCVVDLGQHVDVLDMTQFQGAAIAGLLRLENLNILGIPDQRILGQALVERRQGAGLDHLGQHRRLRSRRGCRRRLHLRWRRFLRRGGACRQYGACRRYRRQSQKRSSRDLSL